MDCQSPINRTHRQGRRPIALVLGLTLLVAACSAAAGPTNLGSSAATRSAAPSVPPSAAIPSSTGVPSPSLAASPRPAPSLGTLALKWQKGGPVAGSPSTWWPAVDPTTGDIWVSAAYEDRIWILSPSGKFLESWGTPGSGAGQIKLLDNAPHPDPVGSIAFRPDGGFYLGDVGNYRIEQFDAKRQFIRQWGTFGTNDGQFSQIVGVVTDGTTVYVVDGDRSDIQAFDANGKHLRTFGGSDRLPGFAALDRSGNLFVSYGEDGAGGGIVKYDSTGQEIGRYPFPVTGDGQGVAVDAKGDIYYTVGDSTPPYQSLGTYELAPDGHLLRGWSTGAESVAISAAGDTLYFAREANDGTGWPDVRAYVIPKG